MPTLDDAYRKFGETSEAAQLLETELGNNLLFAQCIDENLVKQDPKCAGEILEAINRNTLGQLLRKLNHSKQSVDALDVALGKA